MTDTPSRDEIDLFCREQIDTIRSLSPNDTENDSDSNIASSDEYRQYPDNDSSITNLFYKCLDCKVDEDKEAELEEKGIAKTTRIPYALNHLALKVIFTRLWPMTKPKADILKSTEFYHVLEANVIRLRAKNSLFRFMQRDGESIYSAQSIINV